VEHAPAWHDEPARFAAAEVPRCSAYQLGDHQRDNGNRSDDFLLKHEIDTGDLLFQERLTIGENETAGEFARTA